MQYHLVYVIFPKTVYAIRSDGFYYPDGKARGHLVKSISEGKVMYHRIQELMRFIPDNVEKMRM